MDRRQQQDPEERAFTGAPDGPPEQPDQTLESNRELLRKAPQDKSGPPPDESPEDDGTRSAPPGYGG